MDRISDSGSDDASSNLAEFTICSAKRKTLSTANLAQLVERRIRNA